jgi:hypothetical protein
VFRPQGMQFLGNLNSFWLSLILLVCLIKDQGAN